MNHPILYEHPNSTPQRTSTGRPAGATTRRRAPLWQHAFTLVEMLLVVTIIGILAALVIPRIVGRSEQARITAAQTDINGGIKSALGQFEVDNGFYPEEPPGFAGAAGERQELARALSGQAAGGSVGESLHLHVSRQAHREFV